MNTLSTSVTCTFCQIWSLANKREICPNRIAIKEVELESHLAENKVETSSSGGEKGRFHFTE